MKRLLAVVLAGLLALVSAAGFAAERVTVAPAERVFKSQENLLRLYVLDLAGADCMLLTDGKQHLLIDVGKENQHPQLAALLGHLGITSAAVFNTHPHSDHAGGVIPLMDVLDIEVFYKAFPEHMTGRKLVQAEVLEALRAKGVPIKRVHAGDTVPFEGTDIRVFQWTEGKNANDQSAVLHIRYGDAAILLTADIGPNGQKYFADTPGLEADIIKVPHHGIEMLRNDFLDTVNPAYAFFTHGRTDTPHTWQRLNRRKTPYHFASRGIIVLTTDGTRWSAQQIEKSLKLKPGK